MNNNTINTDKNRETDILELCKQVLEVTPGRWDNPNGPYETTCPFCSAKNYDLDSHMQDLTHSQDCAYVIAKDLSTGLI